MAYSKARRLAQLLGSDGTVAGGKMKSGSITSSHLHSEHGITTANIAEGSNKYYTDERVDDRSNSLLQDGSNISLTYNDSAGTLTIASTDTNTTYSAGTGLALNTTTFSLSHLGLQSLSDPDADRVAFWDDSAGAFAWLTIGSGLSLSGTTLTGSAQYADSDARGAISVTDAGGDGSVAYNSSTGVITYTGPSAAEVRAHLSAGTGISYSNGAISTNDSAIVHDNLSGFVANEHIDWTTDQGGTNIHTGNYTNTTYSSGDFTHDNLSGFVANEHIDWTTDQGSTNIHAGNYTDTNTTYSSGDFTHDNLSGFVANEHIDWTSSSAGTIHLTNLPAIGLTTVQTAASQSAMLALTTQEGDVVVRSDELKTYMHNGGSAGSMADFTLLATPADSVTSVDGATGVVTLNHDNLTGFVANEHIDWTADQGSTNIHAGNYTNTTYSVGDGGLTQKNFTTTLKTKLDGIAASATNTAAPHYTSAIAVGDGGLTQKNFTTTLKTKLDGIATGATNTSAPHYTSAIAVGDGGLTQKNFTTTLKTKLDGIEASATADQTAAQILTAIKTVDGSGSGLDADLLDGQHASAFLTSFTETNGFIGDGGSGTTHPGTSRGIYTGQLSQGTPVLGLPTTDNSNSILNFNRHGGNYNSQLAFSSNGSMYYRSFSNVAIDSTTTWRKVWDSGNDGSGSGLDADLLDGIHGASFLRSDVDDIYNGNLRVNDMYFKSDSNTDRNFKMQPNDSNNDVGISMYTGSGSHSIQLYGTTSQYGFLDGNWAAWDIRKTKNGAFEVDEGSGLQRVWNAGNDGSGSGLDADLLDGQQGSYYLSTSGKAADSNLLDGIDSTYFTRGDNIYGVFPGASGWNMNDVFTTRNRSGFFDTWSGSNFPSGTSHIHGMQVRHNSGNHYGWQLAGQYNQNANLHVRMVSNNSWSGWYKLWSDGNDGSGSGLDADLLDGQQGSYYLSTSGKAADSELLDGIDSARVVYASGTNAMGTTRLGFASLTNSRAGFYDVHNSGTPTGTWYSLVNMPHSSSNHGHQIAGSFYSAGDIYNRNNSNTTLSAWAKIYNSANDGSGSGLDADLLDGVQGSGYAQLGATNHARTIPNRWFATGDADNNIDFYDQQHAKVHMGNTGKYTSSRATITADSNYWVGSLGWGAVDLNTIMSYGSGFWDSWSLTAHNRPSSYTTHWNGFNALHYANGTTYMHGMQMAMGAGNPSYTYLRGWWANGGTGYGWQKIWTDGNDGSGSGLDADLLDGQHASALVGTHDGHNRNIQAEVGALHFYQDGGNSGQSNHSYAIFQEAGAWSSPYPDLRIAYHTGIKIGGHYSYNGTRFYNNSDMATELLSVGNGDNHVRVAYNLYRGGNTVWDAGNDGSGSGLDADLLDGYNSAENGASTIHRLASNGYSQIQNWTQVGGAGLYSGTNGFHFYPNSDFSYGTARINGAKNGYAGIVMDTGGDVVVGMYDSGGNGGDYYSASWHYYWHRSNACLSLGGSTTSSSYKAYVNGALYATGDVVGSSDRRLKKNINTIENGLAKVEKLRGVTYEWKDAKESGSEGNNVTPERMGVIAQEIIDIVPEVVSHDKENDRYGVSYGHLTGVLIEAIKELNDKVKELEKKLEEK